MTMANHPNRSRAPSAQGALISRRALNLDYALAHDAQLLRAALYGRGSDADRQARDAAQTALDAETAQALAVIGSDVWRLLSALNRRYGRRIPAGSTVWLDLGADAPSQREAALTMRDDGWHLAETMERFSLPNAEFPALQGGPLTAPPALRLPAGAGYVMRLTGGGDLCLDPLPFDDALRHTISAGQ